MSTIPPELHRFLLALTTARRFRDWLYAAPDRLEPWLKPDRLERFEHIDEIELHATTTLSSGDASRIRSRLSRAVIR